MAIDWGAWVYGGSGSTANGMRVGIEAVSWTSVAWDSGSSTLTFNVWTANQYNYNDAQTVTYTGGSLNYQNSQASGTQTMRVSGATATYSYGTNPGTLNISATLSGLYNGSTLRPTVSVNYTSPTKPSPTAPSAPGISASPGNGYVDFTFSDPSDWGSGGASYWRYSSDNVNWYSPPSNPFRITGTNGTSITGYIRAVNGAGLSSTSSTSAIPRTNPTMGTVTATAGIRYIDVSWTLSNNGGFSVDYYHAYKNGTYLGQYTSTSFRDTTLGNGQSAYYTVYAHNTAGLWSTASTSSTVTTPSLPTTPSFNTPTVNIFGQIGLSWSASNGSGYTPTYYITRSPGTYTPNTTATSITDTTVAPYTEYTYSIFARTSVGDSGTSTVTARSLGGIAKIWNGSTYVTVLPKIWNGTIWVDSQARMWNGTEWKHGI